MKLLDFLETSNSINSFSYPLWGVLGKTHGTIPPTIPQIPVNSKIGIQDAPILDFGIKTPSRKNYLSLIFNF